MDSYQDIRVLPDPEFQENTLMAALFAKLHRALVAHGQGDIGVSFPEHGRTLKGLLRLHGSKASLQALEETRWRAGLNDYCSASAIAPVPDTVDWRCVGRIQVKSSPARLLLRSVRKGWITEEEALKRSKKLKAQRCDRPFLPFKSVSSGQSFRLYIRHGDIQTQPVYGTFSSYGLSDKATIPWF